MCSAAATRGGAYRWATPLVEPRMSELISDTICALFRGAADTTAPWQGTQPKSTKHAFPRGGSPTGLPQKNRPEALQQNDSGGIRRSSHPPKAPPNRFGVFMGGWGKTRESIPSRGLGFQRFQNVLRLPETLFERRGRDSNPRQKLPPVTP